MTPSRAGARLTVQQAALEYLRGRIADGSLAPHDRIRQEHVADELGSSVVPVREALKTLEAEGQVVYVPHRGYQVRRLGIDELTETYRLRELLEDEAVRLAAPNLTDEVFGVLENAMRAMEAAARSGDVATMTEENRRFHFTIYAAAGSPRMMDFIRQLWQSTDAYRSRYYGETAHLERVNDEHRRIVAAFRQGDVDAAITLLHAHRAAAVHSLQALLGPVESEEEGHTGRLRPL